MVKFRLLVGLHLLALVTSQDDAFEFLMQQTSVWIEHRYATTEIGILIENKSSKREGLSLSYELKQSDYIHNLYAEIGNERYEGKVMEKGEAERFCQDAEKQGRPCATVKSEGKAKSLNNFRRFVFTVNVPASTVIKVWLRFSSIIYLRQEKLTHEISITANNGRTLTNTEEIFQIFIQELEDIKSDSVQVTCNDNPVDMENLEPNSEPWEYGGRNSNLKKACRSRRGKLGTKNLAVTFEVDRVQIYNPLTGTEDEDHNGVILVEPEYFLHILHNKDVKTRPSKRVIFVLDTSGSMKKKIGKSNKSRLDKLKDAVGIVLDSLVDGDEFNLMGFSGNKKYNKFRGQVVSKTKTNVNDAKDWIRTLTPKGSTYLKEPIFEAIDMCMNESDDLTNTIIVVTDGQIFDTGGIENIIDEGLLKRSDTQLQINTLSLGSEYHTEQMNKLAYAFGGTYDEIIGNKEERLEVELRSFYEKTSIPLFHNVNVNYTNVDEATLFFEKTILDGEELIVLGRNEQNCTNPNPDGDFALGGEELSFIDPYYSEQCFGELPPASYEFPRNELSSGRDSNTQTTLEQMYAYYTIIKLSQRLKGMGDGSAGYDEFVDRVVNLAKKYNFVTDYTSFVLDNSRDFIASNDEMSNNPIQFIDNDGFQRSSSTCQGPSCKLTNCIKKGDCSAFSEILTDELCNNQNFKQDFHDALFTTDKDAKTCEIFPFDPNYAIVDSGFEKEPTMSEFWDAYIGDRTSIYYTANYRIKRNLNGRADAYTTIKMGGKDYVMKKNDTVSIIPMSLADKFTLKNKICNNASRNPGVVLLIC